MAQELKSISLVAPAFKGINTEDSPLAQDPSFAENADNAVIDKRGRIAARKGLTVITTDKTQLGTASIEGIKEFRDNAGNTKIFSVGNNKILSGTATLADETPGGYTISANKWKMVNFNDSIYFFQRGYQPLVYNVTASGSPGGANSSVVTLSSVNSAAGVTSAMYGNEVLAAYGRLWTADFATNKSIIYWSDLLIGYDWSGGTSGSIDISKVWPDGFDEIVALAAHNNLLIIFGKRSIVVYGGADAPATMALTDTVAGVGCVDRDTVQYTGTDVLFLSQTGLKSFGRTIQEKSMPISSLSGTITTDIIQLINETGEVFKSIYHPEESFYLLSFVEQGITFCFDVRGTLENGSYRVTRWPGTGFTSYERKDNGELLIGSRFAIGQYLGYRAPNYASNGDLEYVAYGFSYFSPEMTFGDASKLKFLKKLRPTIVGGSGADAFIKWSYDFGSIYNSASIGIRSQGRSEFSTSEYPAYSELAGYGISSTGNVDIGEVVVVNKFLGDFTSAPTTGSGGGALLNGDSYFDTANDIFYVYISGAFVDLDTLVPATVSEFSDGELTSRNSVSASGSGTTLTIGIEADIDGEGLSIQDINVLALIGKTL
jgi:hypothetical protein